MATKSVIRPLAIIAAIGVACAALGALLVQPADEATTRPTDIVWRVPEGPPLTFTPVLGTLSTELSATGLFGYPLDANPAEGAQSSPSGPDSDDRLPTLLVLGQKDDRMVAIARLEDGSLQTFSVGDRFESGWTILTLTSSRIEIERDGDRDEIFLREPLPTSPP